MAREQRLDLLENAGSTGTWQKWYGGKGLLTVEGTTPDVQLQVKSANGTPLDVNTNVTAAGVQEFDLPPGEIRAKVNGGSSLYVYAVGIPTH